MPHSELGFLQAAERLTGKRALPGRYSVTKISSSSLDIAVGELFSILETFRSFVFELFKSNDSVKVDVQGVDADDLVSLELTLQLEKIGDLTVNLVFTFELVDESRKKDSHLASAFKVEFVCMSSYGDMLFQLGDEGEVLGELHHMTFLNSVNDHVCQRLYERACVALKHLRGLQRLHHPNTDGVIH